MNWIELNKQKPARRGKYLIGFESGAWDIGLYFDVIDEWDIPSKGYKDEKIMYWAEVTKPANQRKGK